MISLEQCAAFAGLADYELAASAPSANMSRSLYASYMLHLGRGAAAVRDMIVSDIRLSRELGAAKQAADLAAVLRAFLSDYPEGRLGRPPDAIEDREYGAESRPVHPWETATM